MEDELMRIAVIGAGRIGQFHARALADMDGIDALVISDLDVERANAAAAAVDGSVAPTPEAAMDAADAVLIAANTDAHAALLRAAVERGLPAFCEKPLALDLDATRELVDDVVRLDGVVQVGFQRRFDAAYREAKAALQDGRLGTVYLIRLIAHDHEPPPDHYIPVSGGLFRDSSIHDFDALRWFTGAEATEVYAVGTVHLPVFERYDDVDTAVATIRMSDGTLACLSQTRHDVRGYDIRMEAVGSSDSVAVGLSPRTPIASYEPDAGAMFPGPAWQGFLERFEMAYRSEIGEFLRLARGEIASPCTVHDGLEAMRISVAATRSRIEGRPVPLAEV
jgi:myo-inositol 2-dehydrogenase/D-chiro-inositol 1-dehydrogenase